MFQKTTNAPAKSLYTRVAAIAYVLNTIIIDTITTVAATIATTTATIAHFWMRAYSEIQKFRVELFY